MERPIAIINLDPATPEPVYPVAANITDLINLENVMNELELGPNGAMLHCMEYLEHNFDWLEEVIEKLGRDAYIAFDLPGQVELSTDHSSLKNIINRLVKKDVRVCFRLQTFSGPLTISPALRSSSNRCSSCYGCFQIRGCSPIGTQSDATT